jgi:hypothetical protein
MSSEGESMISGALLPLNKGHYIATNMSNNLQVAYDSFDVHEADDGVVVESKHRIFGGNLPVQTANFALDTDWTPRRLDVSAEEMMTTIEFGEAESSISVRTPQGEQRMCFPVSRRRAYLLISGGLYFPMHIVRRFRFEDPVPQHFDLVPSGICEVTRIEDLHEEDETFRQLEMRLQVEGIEDLLHLTVNQCGDLVRYRTRNQNLLVKLDDRE